MPLDDVEVAPLSEGPADAPVKESTSARIVDAALTGVGILRVGLSPRIASSAIAATKVDLAIPVADRNGSSSKNTWSIASTERPIARGLSSSWDESVVVYGTQVVEAPDVTLVAATAGAFGEWPALVARETSGGVRQVYINATFADEDGLPSSSLDALLKHAVWWATGRE